MTDDAVGLVNRNLGNPPPFRKSFRYCNDRVPDSVEKNTCRRVLDFVVLQEVARLLRPYKSSCVVTSVTFQGIGRTL